METDHKSYREMRLLEAFRIMDERAKGETLRLAEYQAQRYPHHQRPKLRVIQGGCDA